MNLHPTPIPASSEQIASTTGLALSVFRAHGALLQWGDALVAPLGLTSARWQVLGALALAGRPLTAPQIGAAMGITRQGAQKQLNLLLGLELVQARRNPAHQRSPLYALTQQGEQLYRQAEALWARHIALFAADAVPAQARAAAELLDALVRHLDATHLAEVP